MWWGRVVVLAALLASVTSGCSAPPEPDATPTEPLRVLFAGDSITAGYYATDESRSYAALLAAAWESDGRVEITRAEEAGARAWRIARRVEDLPVVAVDVAVVEVGANDVGKTPVPVYLADVQGLVEQIVADSPGATIVCLGPWNDPVASRPYDRVVRRICDGGGRVYVAISDLYATDGLRGPVGADTAYGPRDDFHPNDLAHAEIARRILGATTVGG